MSGKAFQSKLVPYAETIAQMRRDRKTWKEIAEHLSSVGCKTDLSGVHHFFKRWTKKPYALGMEPEGESLGKGRGLEAEKREEKERLQFVNESDQEPALGAALEKKNPGGWIVKKTK